MFTYQTMIPNLALTLLELQELYQGFGNHGTYDHKTDDVAKDDWA